MAQKLKKNLNLFDVYAMSTGAMFSSGLFLLPGIAAGFTGDSVYLAYFAAGFLILPAMYCIAELSTAMPKAGGTYYFLDRAMGPLMGARFLDRRGVQECVRARGHGRIFGHLP